MHCTGGLSWINIRVIIITVQLEVNVREKALIGYSTGTYRLMKFSDSGKSRVHGAIGFCFDSHWLKNERESFKPITRRSNRNHVITFDSHLKTALKSIE